MNHIQQMLGFALSPDGEENLGKTFVIHTEYVGKKQITNSGFPSRLRKPEFEEF